MRHCLASWLALLVLTMGCCPITSEHPLASIPDDSYEKRLAGIWQLDATDDRVFLHLGRNGNGEWQVLIVEHKPDGDMEQASFGVTTTAIGGRHYLTVDLQRVSEKHREGGNGYILLKYALPDNYTLNLSRMNLDAVATAIQGGLLAGELQYDQTSVLTRGASTGDNRPEIKCARITAASAPLAEFLAEAQPDTLFSPYLSFKRVPCIPLKQ